MTPRPLMCSSRSTRDPIPGHRHRRRSSSASPGRSNLSGRVRGTAAHRPGGPTARASSAAPIRRAAPDRELDALAAVGGHRPGSSPTTSRTTCCVGAEDERAVEDHVRGDRRQHQQATSGLTIGPRAENEYAVDPVGVATTTPSAENVVTYSPSTSTASRTSRCRARFSTMISFSPHCGTNAVRRRPRGRGEPLLDGSAAGEGVADQAERVRWRSASSPTSPASGTFRRR